MVKVIISKEELYSGIGRGITIWADIENQLAILFCYCTGNRTGEAWDAFYAIQMFNGKLRSLNAAAKVFFCEPGREEKLARWKNFYNRLDDQSDNRNKLAHFQVRIQLVGKDVEWVLGKPHLPAAANYDERESYLKDVITLKQVKSYCDKFAKLQQELHEFNEANEKNFGIVLALGRVRLRGKQPPLLTRSDGHKKRKTKSQPPSKRTPPSGK